MYVVPPPTRPSPTRPSSATVRPAAAAPTRDAVRSVQPDAALARVLPARRPARPLHPAVRPVDVPDAGAHKVPRGFALYVGLDEQDALAAGADLRQVVERLRRHLAEIIPGSESAASVVVAPPGSGGRSLDVVRSVTRATEGTSGGRHAVPLRPSARGVVIDLARGRVLVDGGNIGVTSTELALLRLLVLHPGRDVDRAEVVDALWGGQDGPRPSPRTVDVHVRRLRARLGEYEDVVRTVRGSGYRFDPHPDVVVEGLPRASGTRPVALVPPTAPWPAAQQRPGA